MTMPASKQGAEIHRRLEREEPVQHIADETGLSLSQVHRHKRGACSCRGPAPAATVEAIAAPSPVPDTVETVDPWMAAPGAPIGNVIRGAYVVGIGLSELAEELGMDIAVVEAEVTPSTRREEQRRRDVALDTLARRNPAKWLAHEQAERERSTADDARTSIDPELITSFVADVIAHQRALFIPSDFQAFVSWLRDLAEGRYPDMLPVIVAAIAAEEKGLENLVN